MKRNILFRGKRIDGRNNWAYGSLITNGEKCYLINPDNLEIGCNNTIGNTSVQPVIPETVGQFTGLKDKNGVNIFEGDKINVGEIWHGDMVESSYIGVVSFCDGCWWVADKEVIGSELDSISIINGNMKVIGNTYTN